MLNQYVPVATPVRQLRLVKGLPAVPVPQTANTGACVSFTVTLKVLVLLLPLASVAVAVTGVVPTLKNEPEAGLNVTVGAAVQLSLTACVPASVTLAPHWPAAALATTGVPGVAVALPRTKMRCTVLLAELLGKSSTSQRLPLPWMPQW